MLNQIRQAYPPPDQILEMPAEELAPFLLNHLHRLEENGQDQRLHLGNYCRSEDLRALAGSLDARGIVRAITEAWIWLEREGMLAPRVEQGRDWVFITRRGRRLLQDQNWDAFRRGDLLNGVTLHPRLAQTTKPAFARGEYETSVFLAFKAVEVAVRLASGLSNDSIGVNLMRAAFHPENGPLVDQSRERAEREAMAALFAGAIGVFKNPASHRDVEWTDPQEAAEVILFANYLLRLIDSQENN